MPPLKSEISNLKCSPKRRRLAPKTKTVRITCTMRADGVQALYALCRCHRLLQEVLHEPGTNHFNRGKVRTATIALRIALRKLRVSIETSGKK